MHLFTSVLSYFGTFGPFSTVFSSFFIFLYNFSKNEGFGEYMVLFWGVFSCILMNMSYFRDFGVSNGLSLDPELRLDFMVSQWLVIGCINGLLLGPTVRRRGVRCILIGPDILAKMHGFGSIWLVMACH